MSAAISAKLVKELRDQTGAGMMDCKKALAESSGDLNAAIEFLRKKGLKSLEKRSGKTAAEGTIFCYTHGEGRIAVMLELNCETDFVARGDKFQDLAKSLAMHAAWSNPRFLKREEIPEDVIAKEKEILESQLTDKQKESGKVEGIITGQLGKFYSENCMLEQLDAKDPSTKKTIGDIIKELSVEVGEKIDLRRLVRFEVGEGIQKEETNYADEVAAAMDV